MTTSTHSDAPHDVAQERSLTELDEWVMLYKLTGDDEAFERITQLIWPYVRRECRFVYGTLRRKSWYQSLCVSDLIQESWIKIEKLTHSYDPAAGASFFTYLHTARLRSYLYNRVARRHLFVPHPSLAEAEHPELAEPIRRLERCSSGTNETMAFDIPEVDTALEFVEKGELFGLLIKCLDHIGGRRKEIVLRRVNGESLQDIADDHGITRERIRQIEARSLVLLREAYMNRQYRLVEERRDNAKRRLRSLMAEYPEFQSEFHRWLSNPQELEGKHAVAG